MKVGDLVKPLLTCAGYPGHVRCDSALVVSVELSHHEQVQLDSHDGYHDRAIYEYTLQCACGPFDEYEDHLDLISESR